MSELSGILWLAVAFILLFLFPVLLRWHTKRGAKRILDQQKAIYSGTMEYAEVDPRSFPWLDMSFYEDFASRMAAEGFRFIGDFECVTVSRKFPNMRSCMRCLVGDDGTTMAAGYHINVRGMIGILGLLRIIPKHMRSYDFESEFDDHTFLCTNNCAGLNALSPCPGITTEQLDPATPLEELLTRHRELRRGIVAERQVRALRFATKAELLASQDRMHKLKSDHRQSVGYVTRDEFAAMAGGALSEPQHQFVDDFEDACDNDRAG